MTESSIKTALHIKNGYVDVPIGQVHYRSLGEGEPLLLLAQGSWSSIQFVPALPYFAARGFRAIALDTPGYGMSDNFAQPPTMVDYATVLAASMDGLNIATANIAGHHTGGFVAGVFAALYPQRVSRLVMHGAPPYTPEERAAGLARPHVHKTPQPDGSHLIARWKMARDLTPEATLAATQCSLLEFWTAAATENPDHHPAYLDDFSPYLARLSMPTLILSNTGDFLHPLVDRIRKIRPDFSYVAIPGGTHHLIFDDPQPWSQIVSEFVLSR